MVENAALLFTDQQDDMAAESIMVLPSRLMILPSKGTQVLVFRPTGNHRGGRKTDSFGVAALQVPAPGTYYLVVSRLRATFPIEEEIAVIDTGGAGVPSGEPERCEPQSFEVQGHCLASLMLLLQRRVWFLGTWCPKTGALCLEAQSPSLQHSRRYRTLS